MFNHLLARLNKLRQVLTCVDVWRTGVWAAVDVWWAVLISPGVQIIVRLIRAGPAVLVCMAVE